MIQKFQRCRRAGRSELFPSFRGMLQTVDLPIGMLTALIDPDPVETVGHARFDFVVFDNDDEFVAVPEIYCDMVRHLDHTPRVLQ